jgi:hypothetical protein
MLQGSLDLFVLLVEYVFGSILLAILGWAVIILITGIMGRMNFESILVIILTYIVTASVGYLGALVAVPILILSLGYMFFQIAKRMNAGG